MNDEQKVAFILGQIALFNCEVAGMVAENTYRERRGDVIAYPEKAFYDLSRCYEGTIGHNAVIGYFIGRS